MRRLLVLASFLLAACGGPPAEQLQATVQSAAVATVAAMPTPTTKVERQTVIVTQVATVIVTATPLPATPKSEPTPPPPTETPAPAAGKWETSQDTSSFDDSPLVVLRLEAEQDIIGPYETYRPSLIVRCKEKQLDVYVNVGMQPDVEGVDPVATARMRFDDTEAFDVKTDVSTDRKALFLPVPDTLVGTLANYDRLLFGFTPFNGSPVEMEFDLRGLGNALPPLDAACPRE